MSNFSPAAQQQARQLVREVGTIRLVGNIIPHRWYHELTRPNGKPYNIAITLLGEIVYWYRPIVAKDEATGRLLALRPKFAGHKYRTSYRDLANQFGFSREQVIDAVAYLKRRGVITAEVKARDVIGGRPCGNVLYLEVVPEVLRQISILPEVPAPSMAESLEGELALDDADVDACDPRPCIPATRTAASPRDATEESRAGKLSLDDADQPPTPTPAIDPHPCLPAILTAASPRNATAESRAGKLSLDDADPHPVHPTSLTDSSPRPSTEKSLDPLRQNPQSLKGTQIPAKTPPQIPGEVGAALAELRAEGIVALAEFADVPVEIIRAAAADTHLPRGHGLRPAWTVKRLRLWRQGQWTPVTARAAAPPSAPPPDPRPSPPAAPPPAAPTLTPLWTQVQAELSRAVPPEVFATWLSATHLAELRDGTAIIATPNVFARDKLADDYLPLLTTTLQTVLGYPAQVQIVIGGGA